MTLLVNDMSGKKVHRAMREKAYETAHVLILCYSCDDENESVKKLEEEWLKKELEKRGPRRKVIDESDEEEDQKEEEKHDDKDDDGSRDSQQELNVADRRRFDDVKSESNQSQRTDREEIKRRKFDEYEGGDEQPKDEVGGPSKDNSIATFLVGLKSDRTQTLLNQFEQGYNLSKDRDSSFEMNTTKISEFIVKKFDPEK